MADKNALYLPKGSVVGPPPAGQVAILAEADGTLKSMDSAGTKTAIGGGTFGSDVAVVLQDSLGGNVNGVELVTSLPVNTSGGVTSEFAATGLVVGVPVTQKLLSANLAGKQLVTTSTGTPTIALSPRADWLQIIVNADTTKILITGLDLGTDAEYIIGVLFATPASAINVSLNDSDATGQVEGFFFSLAGAITTIAQNTVYLSDSGAANVYARGVLTETKPNSPKMWSSVLMRENSLFEQYAGRSTLTANVTSISLSGVKNGSVINLRRGRPSVA